MVTFEAMVVVFAVDVNGRVAEVVDGVRVTSWQRRQKRRQQRLCKLCQGCAFQVRFITATLGILPESSTDHRTACQQQMLTI
jgi:hypothetical protein